MATVEITDSFRDGTMESANSVLQHLFTATVLCSARAL